LLADLEARQARLFRKHIAEPQAVVVQAEHDVERAPRANLLAQGDGQLVVVVADLAPLAPGLLPGFIKVRAALGNDLQVALELGRVGEYHAQPRRRDDRPAAMGDRIARASVAVGGQLDADHFAWRASFRDGGRGLRGGEAGSGAQQQGQVQATDRHRASSWRRSPDGATGFPVRWVHTYAVVTAAADAAVLLS